MARPELSTQFVAESASESESSGAEVASNGKSKTSIRRENRQIDEASQSSDESSTSTSEDEASEDSETSPDVSDHNERKRKAVSSQSSASKKKAKSVPSYIPARAYQPPTGYGPLKSTAQHSMKSADLESKQVWHLVAPASVPLSKIKSFNLQASLRGEPILEYQGTKYNLQTASAGNDTLLLAQNDLVSTGRGSEVTTAYKTSTVPVTRTLYLREMTSSTTQDTQANHINGSSSGGQTAVGADSLDAGFFATKRGAKKAPRQQPRGLMMRYHPFGSQKGGKEKMHSLDETAPSAEVELTDLSSSGFGLPSADSDDEMQIDSVPKAVKTIKSDKKKKGSSNADEDGNETAEPPKKSKKDKKSRKVDSAQENRKIDVVGGDRTRQLSEHPKVLKERKKKDKH